MDESRQAQDQSVTDVSACQTEDRDPNPLLQQLEASNQALTEFAYIVSHDLKAPLRGIKTLAGWIVADCHDKLGPEGRQHLALLRSRIERMENMINGILNYSRAGCSDREDRWVELNELLAHVIDMIDPPESITVSVQDSLPALFGDRTRIVQVFQNLIGNAVKYMDKVQGQVAVACEDQDDRWVFRVVDNGPGIEARHHDTIFKVFQTLASRDEIESSGIGLSVVRRVVEHYGGRVWVNSVVGEGSTFFFSWPKTGADSTEAMSDEGRDQK